MEYVLKVTANDVNVIWEALISLPYNKVAGLITELRKQVTEQEEAAKPIPEEVKEEVKEEITEE